MAEMRAAAVLFAALALVGCGGDAGAGTESPASVLKPGALVYWEAVSDPESEQWEQVEDLLRRFPDGDKWIAWLKQELREKGADWDKDVKPALGDLTAVAVYADVENREPAIVGLTNSEDPDKTFALVNKLTLGEGELPGERVAGVWAVVGSSEAAIDVALKGGGEALADDEQFTSAMDELPDDALSRIYLDPARAIDVVSPQVGRLLGLENLDFAAAWAKAREDGAEVSVALRGEGAHRLLGTGEPYTSELLDMVPDDAFAFVSFRGQGLKGQLEQLRSNRLVASALREFEREVGIDVMELATLLDGEVAFFIRPGVPTAEFTLLLDSEDPQSAKRSIEPLLRFVPERFRITVETLDDVVVLSTSLNPLADLERPGDKLGDSDRFTEALDAAGAPDQYTGLVYVDLREAAALVGALLDSPGIRRNLEPLRTFVAYGTSEGDAASVRAFLEID